MSRAGLVALVERWIDTRLVKGLLGALIVLSVLPDPALEARLRSPLLVLFGLELALRVGLAARRRTRPTRREAAFFVIDALALASFLPFEAVLAPMHLDWARLLRLFRLVALLRYAEELTADVYRAVTHREQLAQFWLVSVAVFAASFAAAVALSQVAVPPEQLAAGEGAAGFVDRMWWAFRQLESPDNIVQTLRVHPALAAVSLLLTTFGVFLISYVIGIGANVVDQVVRAERRRPVGFGGHTVVLGSPTAHEPLVRELVRLYEKNRRVLREGPRGLFRWLTQSGPVAGRPVVPRTALLGEDEAPPPYLYEPAMRRVAYRQGDGSDPSALARVAASFARRALILRDPAAGADADAVSLARLSALRAHNAHAHVFVEVARSDHGDIVRAVGGEGTYVLDVPKFLGYFLAQHLVVPGVADLLRELLSARGCEVYTHVFADPEERAALAGRHGATVAWDRMAALAHEAHRVTLLGVLLGDGAIEPHPLSLVGADGLAIFVNPTDEPGAACRALGATRGRVRASSIRGFIGISETYFPIRDFSAVFCGRPDAMRKADTDGASEALRSVLDALVVPPPRLERVLVVGYSPALPWLVRGLARSVPAIDVRVVLAVSSGEDAKLERWLDSLRYGLEAPASDGTTVELPRGGRLTVSTYVGPDRTGFADDVLGAHGADAVVFLSDVDAPDADARVSLQALKLVRAACRSGHLEMRRRLHLLVELRSVHRGELLRRDLVAIAGGSLELEITRVSTEELKSYFMVQGAIVPGILGLYESLLGEPGQSITLVAVESEDATPRRYGDLREALAELGCIPIALRLANGGLVTNPRADAFFAPRDLRAVFGVADPGALSARLEARRVDAAEAEPVEPEPTAA